MSDRQLTQDHLDLKTVLAMKEIFSSKDRWIRGHTAANINGRIVEYNSFNAYKFCFMGALAHVIGKKPVVAVLTPDTTRIFGYSCSHLVTLNDGKGYTAIMAVLDDAEVRLNNLIASPKC